MATNTDTSKTINAADDNKPTGSEQRPYTIVLYGATSFVGQITAHYLTSFLSDAKNKNGDSVTWAIAGRDEDKLNELQSKLENKVDIIIANSKDAASLDKMTKQTQVIISTVGPYLKYGEPLIKSCAENGTDYVDLTGEAIFIKDMMDKYQETAKESGARIVNSCGFDSIPSDLGVYFTQQQAESQFDSTCDVIHMRVKAAKGVYLVVRLPRWRPSLKKWDKINHVVSKWQTLICLMMIKTCLACAKPISASQNMTVSTNAGWLLL